MNEQERRAVEARAELTGGLLDATNRWTEISELVAASGNDVEATGALTRPPFRYSDDVASAVLNMQLRRLTRSWRSEAEAELQELHALLEDDGD